MTPAAEALYGALRGMEKPGNGRVVIGIDGRCAAGKTTLAAALAARLGEGCAVVHLDDFFLQPAQRTPARLAEPGGNLDRERVLAEVLEPLAAGAPVAYRVFSCRTMAFAERRTLPETAGVVLVEGSYACHPALRGYYGLTMFLDVSPDEQRRRLAARCPERLEDFRTRWIPMEERYIAHYAIPEHCDLVQKTG